MATLSPVPGVALTCAELAERWPKLEKLRPEEATAFADDLERAQADLPPVRSAWDWLKMRIEQEITSVEVTCCCPFRGMALT